METAVTIYRDLNGAKVRQNHKTGFFNANDLLNLYNSTNKPKELQTYLKTHGTKEWMDKISAEISDNSNMAEKHDLNLGVIETKKGRVNGGTWMHPYLFIDFAMWLSVDFKFSCVKWLHDNLIQMRDEAGNGFKEVNQALFEAQVRYDPYAYSNEAKMINRLTFGSSDAGQRNLATKEQLELLATLQRADIKLIQQGLSYSQRLQKLIEFRNLASR